MLQPCKSLTKKIHKEEISLACSYLKLEVHKCTGSMSLNLYQLIVKGSRDAVVNFAVLAETCSAFSILIKSCQIMCNMCVSVCIVYNTVDKPTRGVATQSPWSTFRKLHVLFSVEWKPHPPGLNWHRAAQVLEHTLRSSKIHVLIRCKLPCPNRCNSRVREASMKHSLYTIHTARGRGQSKWKLWL